VIVIVAWGSQSVSHLYSCARFCCLQAKLSAVKKITGCDAELVFCTNCRGGVGSGFCEYASLRPAVGECDRIVASNNSDMCLPQVDEHLLHDGVAGMLDSDMIRAARSLGTVISVISSTRVLRVRFYCSVLTATLPAVHANRSRVHSPAERFLTTPQNAPFLPTGLRTLRSTNVPGRTSLGRQPESLCS
jgi:hypothetical protein